MNKSHSEVASIVAWFSHFLYHTIQHTLTACYLTFRFTMPILCMRATLPSLPPSFYISKPYLRIKHLDFS